jgi:hypothetical protein
MRSVGWALIQYDKCPYDLDTHTHTHTHTRQCEDTQGEDVCDAVPAWTAGSHCQSRRGKEQAERASERAQPYSHVDFGILASRTERGEKVCCFQPPSFWCFLMDDLAN